MNFVFQTAQKKDIRSWKTRKKIYICTVLKTGSAFLSHYWVNTKTTIPSGSVPSARYMYIYSPILPLLWGIVVLTIFKNSAATMESWKITKKSKKQKQRSLSYGKLKQQVPKNGLRIFHIQLKHWIHCTTLVLTSSLAKI